MTTQTREERYIKHDERFMTVVVVLILLLFFFAPAVEASSRTFMEAVADSKTYIEIGAGWNGNLTGASIPWDNADTDGAYFAIRNEWELTPKLMLIAHWSHYSQYWAGKPFNFVKGDESSLDHVGVAFRFRIR